MALCLHVFALIFYVLIGTFFFNISIFWLVPLHYQIWCPIPIMPLPDLWETCDTVGHCLPWILGHSNVLISWSSLAFPPQFPLKYRAPLSHLLLLQSPRALSSNIFIFPMDTYDLPDHILCNGLEIASTFNFLGLTSV